MASAVSEHRKLIAVTWAEEAKRKFGKSEKIMPRSQQNAGAQRFRQIGFGIRR
jgi:hypothetical protein